MADLLALKKVRSGIKGSLTRMENFITANAKSLDVSIDELKVRMDTVQALKLQFQEVEAKMFVLDATTESQMEEFESKYYLVAGKLNSGIRKLSSRQGTTGKLDESLLNSTQAHSAEIKLKKLSIPTFSGEYTEWPSFYDLYEASIHSKDYPAVQKFQYLKSLLTGEAAQLVRYFNVTEANYYEAYSKLVERYDRKKYIVNAFIRTFMDQPAINQVNCSNIRKLRDTSDEVLRGLKALDPKAENRDNWLIYILLKKLDQETKMLWARESTEAEYPTMKEFFDFLNKRCDALEAMSSYTKAKPASMRTLVTEANHPSVKTWSCPVCKSDNHLLYECQEFAKMALSARKGIVTSDRRCFNCLHKGHIVYDCRAKKRCKLCQRRHHSLLHEDVINGNANKVLSHMTQDDRQESELITTKKEESGATSLQTDVLYSMQAILPTVIVRVKDANNKFKLCRALLDSASQVTFITDACVQKLGVKVGSGNLMVSGLGQTKLGRTNGSVELEIVSRLNEELKLQVQAYVVPKITTLQPSSKINIADLTKIKSLQLADPKFNEAGHIDLLLGVEVFFTVMKGKQLKISPMLTAQETTFGWVVGGQASETKNGSEVPSSHVTLDVDNALRRFWELKISQ